MPQGIGPAHVAPGVVEGVRFQHAAFGIRSLASPLYEAFLAEALDDVEVGGPVARVLAEVPAELDPIPDAVVLRFLGGLHRLVLRGEAPALARWFPTAGGSFDPDDPAQVDAARTAFAIAVGEHHEALVAALLVGVQTNEMSRCAPLAVGFTEVLRRTSLPLRLLEVGSSAGLNLRWDRWRYESGSTSWGAPGAAVRFADNYRSPAPDVSAPLDAGDAVAERRGCDRSPIDPTTEDGRLFLRAFVWPDQPDRHRRLDAALAVAGDVPAPVDAADAEVWLAAQLAEPRAGVASVVFHSIVWSYLSPATKAGVTGAIEAAGAAASPEAPVAWLRMEPPDEPSDAAEIRLRLWAGGAAADDGADRVLARTGYHGHPVWAGSSPRPG